MEGIERIKKLSQEQKDANIQKVAEYLINREDMDEKYLNEEKNLIDMWDYIKEQAREKAVNGCAVIEDQEVYSLAIHYFDETNEALGIKTNKKTAKETKQDAKTEENASNSKQDAPVQEEKKNKEVPKHKDDEIVMKYKGRPVTYKEFKDGTYLQLS